MPEHNSARPTVRCLRFCLNWLQIEQCTFVWHSAALVLHIMWRPHFSSLRSLSHCPWCIFHVRWKDKHSCNLMTLQCFWDSNTCARTCIRVRCVFFCVRLCSLQWIPVEALNNDYTCVWPEECQVAVMPAIKWLVITPLVDRFTLRLYSRPPLLSAKTWRARKHTTHADECTHVDSEEPPPEGMRPTVNFKWSWKQKCCRVINETNTHMAPLSFSLSLSVPR